MSNERVTRTAEAIEDLKTALKTWSGREDARPNGLDVHTAGQDAVALIDEALTTLHAIRNETVSEIRAYKDAQGNRLDHLLGVVLVGPLVAEARTGGTVPSDYKCGDCGKVFPIDPDDPIESHGAYLDHMDDHERDDTDNCDQADTVPDRPAPVDGWWAGPETTAVDDALTAYESTNG